MKKILSLFGAILLSALAVNAQLAATLEISNDSEKIKDGRAQVVITDGVAPYVYKWSNPDTPLNSSNSSGLIEGVDFTVSIMDANGSQLTLEGRVPAESTEEKINSVFLPVVGGLGSVLFWDPFEAIGVYDPVVYADQLPVFA
ncbi:MAG: amino acid carrier protein, partial [Cryomorphaceae bacterium]